MLSLSVFSLCPVLSVCLSSAFLPIPAFALCLVWSCLAPFLLMVVAAFTFLSFSGPGEMAGLWGQYNLTGPVLPG